MVCQSLDLDYLGLYPSSTLRQKALFYNVEEFYYLTPGMDAPPRGAKGVPRPAPRRKKRLLLRPAPPRKIPLLPSPAPPRPARGSGQTAGRLRGKMKTLKL